MIANGVLYDNLNGTLPGISVCNGVLVDSLDAPPPDSGTNIFVKVSGSWVEVSAFYVKYDGSWKESQVSVKNIGNWVQV